MENKELNVFKEQDISDADLPVADETRFGSSSMRDGKEIQIGAGNTVFRANESGMWLGSAKFANAPFRVDMNGNVYASSISLTGYIPTGGAASDVNSGVTTISGGKITTNSITADKISVSSLSAISADIGTITAGTITGVTFKTASSGQRIELTTTLASYYNSSGTLIVQTYANSSTFLVKGSQSTSNIYLDCGSSGTIAFIGNGTVMFIVSPTNSSFYPNTTLTYNLGESTKRWSTIYGDSVNASSSMTLNGSTITSWPTSGASTLSALSINTTKDWAGYGITNIDNIQFNGSGSYIDSLSALYFISRSSNPGSPDGAIWYYNSGGVYQMRTYLVSARYSFDLTGV